MSFYIREWPDKTATLMADTGAVLWTFASVDEALSVCREWYSLQAIPNTNCDGLMDPLISSCAVA